MKGIKVSDIENKSKGCAFESGVKEKQEARNKMVAERMRAIKNKVLVLSGKGGVGKSTVAVNLATSISLAGKRTGLLDIDFHGPSIPKLLRLEGRPMEAEDNAIKPIEYSKTMKVMSLGFAMQEQNEAVIWRGPMKHGVIQQFLADVNWGALDYLVVDSPPGTGDEPLSIAQLLADDAKAVIVTTPQEISLSDVRKSIAFCRKVSLPVLGVIENMSGFVCPHCGKSTDIFKSGGGEEMALRMEVPFLGRIPLDHTVVESCDAGKPFTEAYKESETAKAFQGILESVL